jgi:hypothetical protein
MDSPRQIYCALLRIDNIPRQLTWLFIVLAVSLLTPSKLHAQAGTTGTYSRIIVTGTADVQGNNLLLGTWSEGGGFEGLQWNYIDGPTATVALITSGSATAWQWWHYNGSATLPTMELDPANRLLLYSGTTPSLILDPSPAGASTVAGSVTINGTDNELPNQNLLDGNSILTAQLGDSRYVQPGSNCIALGDGVPVYPEFTNTVEIGAQSNGDGNGASIDASFAVAIGYASVANGTASSALGPYSCTAGVGSTAFGSSYAGGDYSFAGAGGWTSSPWQFADNPASYSVALGWGCYTVGQYATAFGGSAAYGQYSTSLGTAFAMGDYSTAIGPYGVANAYGSVVIGQYNVVQGNSSAWVPTDDLFVIGNGQSNDAPSDALKITKDGSMVTSGPVIIQPQGDLSMGQFTTHQVRVANDTARFALTTAQVNLNDIVMEETSPVQYFQVVSLTNLNNSSGYEALPTP